MALEAENTGIAPIVTLIPDAATLVLSSGMQGRMDLVRMSARMPRRQELRTPSGKDLSKAEWTVEFYLRSDGSDGAQDELGGAVYSAAYEDRELGDEPEQIAVWAKLETEQFNLLVQTLLARNSITSVRAKLSGLSYGHAPDGSEKVWDVIGRPRVRLVDITWTTNLTVAVGEVEPTTSNEVDTEGVVAVAQDVRTTLKRIEAAMAASGKHIVWVLSALTAVFAVLLLR